MFANNLKLLGSFSSLGLGLLFRKEKNKEFENITLAFGELVGNVCFLQTILKRIP